MLRSNTLPRTAAPACAPALPGLLCSPIARTSCPPQKRGVALRAAQVTTTEVQPMVVETYVSKEARKALFSRGKEQVGA